MDISQPTIDFLRDVFLRDSDERVEVVGFLSFIHYWTLILFANQNTHRALSTRENQTQNRH